MDAERYKRIRELFAQVLNSDAKNRAGVLSAACGEDSALRAEVEILLAEFERVSSFLGTEQKPDLASLAVAGPRTLSGSVAGFEITRLLGQGGMGEVYLAKQQHPQRQVALKVIRPGLAIDEVLRRFQREADLLGRLQHPGIAQVFDAGVFESAHGPQSYIAMQFIDGESLASVLDQASKAGSKAGLAQALKCIERVARALHAAHEAGVVHRDIKPQNIMIRGDGEPVVVDFGIARDLLEPGHELTNTGDQLGTPVYMSPEQVRALPGTIDRRTDVWALGVVLYEMLCGKRPFDRPTRFGTLGAITSAPLPSAREQNSLVSRDLEVVIATCLERDLGRRYGTALAVAEELARVQNHEPISARPAGPGLRLLRWSQRHPLLAVSLLATVASLVVSLAFLRSEMKAVSALQEQTDGLLAQDLIKRSSQLWPVLPETLGAMDAWIAETDGPAKRFAGYVDRADAAQAPPSLVALRDQAKGFSDTIREVKARRERAIRVGRISLDDHSEQWTESAALLRSLPNYQGIILEPIAGLAPLGFDRSSGLLELWVVGTGEKPHWEGTFEAGRAVGQHENSGMVMILLPQASVQEGAQRIDPKGIRYDPAAEPQESDRLSVKVAIQAFLISKYEVTQGQWMRVMGSNPAYFHPGSKQVEAQVETNLAYPVEQITWGQAADFCRRLGLRLPQEVQWEYAARGGAEVPTWTAALQLPLHEGENLADAACQRVWGKRTAWGFDGEDDGHGVTAPVGSFRANPFGLHDVLGNVREWCADHYNSAQMVTRGADWHLQSLRARASVRTPESPQTVWAYLGVRPAMRLSPQIEDSPPAK